MHHPVAYEKQVGPLAEFGVLSTSGFGRLMKYSSDSENLAREPRALLRTDVYQWIRMIIPNSVTTVVFQVMPSRSPIYIQGYVFRLGQPLGTCSDA